MNELLSTMADISSIGSFLVALWIGSNIVKIKNEIKINSNSTTTSTNQKAKTFFGSNFQKNEK